MKLTVVDIIKQMRLHCADIDEIFFCRNGWLNEKQGELIKSIKVKTGKEDRVFGSVSSKQVMDELKNKGYNISKKQINMEAINTLGFHNVEVVLHKKVSAEVKVKLEK